MFRNKFFRLQSLKLEILLERRTRSQRVTVRSFASKNDEERIKFSPQEKLLMKKERKEATRQERIENQQLKLEKKKMEQRAVPMESFADKSLPDTYIPAFVESKWYQQWVDCGLFNADSEIYQKTQQKDRFVICLPPPNITGSLHLGHALGCSIQDALCRWHRMKGHLVTWVPGCDHAGIATQVVVEKKIKRESGLSRHDLGRKKFLDEVWKWKEQYGGKILEQMKSLGCSLDWSRNSFTLDPKMNRAVVEAFVRLFEEGLIKRSRRLVNWSCALKSAISDIEIDDVTLDGPTLVNVPGYDKKVLFGRIDTFAYPVYDSSEKVYVSTTRLETMLGDVGVAIHPNDPRYSHLIGRSVLHPLTNKLLPIVTDNDVIPDFGTGAVKLTPGHDMTDFNIASRHRLDIISILDDSGSLINVPQEFMNIPRFKAREVVRERLDGMGLYRGASDHPMTLPTCGRSGDVVEYVIKDQWFIDCKDMAYNALEAVNSGKLEFIPSHNTKQWNDWLTNIKDWCISRQLWWGHRIPAYKVVGENNVDGEMWVAAHNEDEAKLKASNILKKPAGVILLKQDEDVLDTWFSSALFPFSVFGWPDNTDDLTRLYPTDLLETASDIMFFWVARMVMMGQKLTGQLPFKKVIFHSIVQDAKGRKMSKSLGNVVDPLHVICGVSLEDLQANLNNSNLSQDEIKKAKPILKRDFPLGIPECGADALRFALCSYNFQGQFMNIDVNYMKFCRTFCNKIWQSYKFISNKIHNYNNDSNYNIDSNYNNDSNNNNKEKFKPLDLSKVHSSLTPIDRWVLSRLTSVVRATNDAFECHKLDDVTKILHKFWWSEFCNVYMECVKPSLLTTNDDSQSEVIKTVLVVCFDSFLKLLHPFMPFLTEHLYQELKKKVSYDDEDGVFISHETISLAPYPSPSRFGQYDGQLEKEVEQVLNLSSRLLSTRNLLTIDKSCQIRIFISSQNENSNLINSDHLTTLKTLARSDSIILLDHPDTPPTGCIHVADVDGCDVHMELKGLVDIDRQLDGLIKNRDKHERERDTLQHLPASTDVHHYQHLMLKEKVSEISTTLNRLNNIIDSLKQI